MRTVTGFLIDPYKKEIRRVSVEVQKGSCLKSLYNHLDCDVVDCVALDENHDIWVDDEALIKDPGTPKRFFSIEKFIPYGVYAGKGLILSTTPTGACGSAKVDLDGIRNAVEWHDSVGAVLKEREMAEKAERSSN